MIEGQKYTHEHTFNPNFKSVSSYQAWGIIGTKTTICLIKWTNSTSAMDNELI